MNNQLKKIERIVKNLNLPVETIQQQINDTINNYSSYHYLKIHKDLTKEKFINF